MIALIVIISIVAIIAFLLSIKITLKVRYTDKPTIYLKILFLKIQLYPKKKKKKRYPHSMSKRKAKKIKNSLKKKPKKQKRKKSDLKEELEEEIEDKSDLFSIVSIIVSFVKNFILFFVKSVRIKAFKLKITVATEDAAKTALTYTAITQSINSLFPLLDKLKTFKKLPKGKDLAVNADFTSETPTVDIDTELYVRVGGALGALCKAAMKAFKKAVKDQLKKLEKQR